MVHEVVDEAQVRRGVLLRLVGRDRRMPGERDGRGENAEDADAAGDR